MSRKASRLLAPLLGAEPADVMVGQSTTVNLHQLLATYYDPTGPAPKILIDEWCFPSDRYAVESHLRLRGRDPRTDLVVVPYRDHLLEDADILAAMDDGVGLAVLPSIVYRSGQLLDLQRLTLGSAEAAGRCHVGLFPFGRRCPTPVRVGRDRPRLRLHVQVPERRAGGGRLAIRPLDVPRGRAGPGRLVRQRPGPAVRDERRVPPGRGRGPVPDRDAARAQSGPRDRRAGTG